MNPTCPDCGSACTGVKEYRSNGSVRYKCHTCNKTWTESASGNSSSTITTDKTVGEFHWREWVPNLLERQSLTKKASSSQDKAIVRIKTPYRCIVLKPLADLHIGDIATDYERLVEFTDAVLHIDYLYLSLTGDEGDNFVSFKSQMAMLSQILSPEQQDSFIESWLTELQGKILFSGWGNHAEFEEKSSARNTVKSILSRNLVYFDGIGVCNLMINDQQYKIVSTHKTRYNSSLNKTHGLKVLARKEIPDADVYLAGHIHDPSYEVNFERGREQIYAVLGSLKHDDVFSKRYFSYFSARNDVALVFDSTTHNVIPFPNLDDALAYAKLMNAAPAEVA